MLKKTQIKELIQNIKKTKVSFISIVLFVMLGATAFLGVSWSTTGFLDTMERTMNTGCMYDTMISYPYGLTDDFIEDVRKLDDVDDVEGFYAADTFFRIKGKNVQTHVVMLTERINIPFEHTGRLPVRADEIAVEKYWAQTNGIRIGDVLDLEEGEGEDARLTENAFTVTALILVPEYINHFTSSYGVSQTTGIPNDCIMFADGDAFNDSVFMGYTNALVRSDSLRQYNSFGDEYKKANKTITKRIKRIADDYAEQRNADLPHGYRACDCAVQERRTNPGMGSVIIPGEIMSKIKYTLAFLFIVVGLFVCYSAVSRIVSEQMKLIGTKTALGLDKKSITLSYLLYAAAAVTIGSAAGCVLARYAIEPVTIRELSKNYNSQGPVYYFSIRDSVLFLLFELAVTTFFAFLACRRILKKKPVQLLKEENAILGRERAFEKTLLWKSFSLLSKTIINNCLNDKKRVLATVTGVVGCCSLMVSALTMISGIYYTKDYQVNKVATYDTRVYIDTTKGSGIDDVVEYFENAGMKSASVYCSNVCTKIKNGYNAAEIIAFDDRHFTDLFHISKDGTDQPVCDGVWICGAYAGFNNLGKGDMLEIIDSEGVVRNIRIGGVFDYYLPRGQILMNAKTFEETFEKDFDVNSVICRRGNKDIGDIYHDLEDIDGFVSVGDFGEETELLFSSVISAVFIVVGAFILISIVLAFAVLLNLLIMFVNEKKRELIVMMINGYSRKQVRRYIYSDTILLTIIGAILGTILGVGVGFMTLKLFDSDCVKFILHLDIPVCLLCMLATGILAGITLMIALKKVEKFRLRDINEM